MNGHLQRREIEFTFFFAGVSSADESKLSDGDARCLMGFTTGLLD